MRLYSENTLRDSGKMFLDVSKLAIAAFCITSQLPDVWHFGYERYTIFTIEAIFFFILGNLLIRLADRMKNQKEKKRK